MQRLTLKLFCGFIERALETICAINQTSFLLGSATSGYHGRTKRHRLAGRTSRGIVDLMLLLLLVTALVCLYRYYEMKGEDQARIEKFLEDYRAMKPTRFTYADIKRITNGFSQSLGEGAHGAVFRGMLSREILVAVKILNDTVGDGKDFINAVGTIGKIHHINIVRLLGFWADGFHRALVYDFFPMGSLQRFLVPPNNKEAFLGWEKLLQIALGVAKAIEYLHLGCDHRILHFDINPHNVLLDDHLVPKVTDFRLAKLCPKNQSTVSMTAAKGTLGYIAPEVFSRDFGKVSYKSDIYSYGMLLLDMHWTLVLQWNPIDRPSMRTVVQMLEGDGNELIAPPTPFDTSSSRTNVIIPTGRKNVFELEVIPEIEEQIRPYL
ncbi:hypothetical protein VNO78_21144 [Psophocarpus tetragonolobus]|uniref:Protein kinase domain-containing protein n=1 Tax=Psophocarpus tetragonolobus TaxID=3891 RepID=A0AAN9SBK0_PSOTE